MAKIECEIPTIDDPDITIHAPLQATYDIDKIEPLCGADWNDGGIAANRDPEIINCKACLRILSDHS